MPYMFYYVTWFQTKAEVLKINLNEANSPTVQHSNFNVPLQGLKHLFGIEIYVLYGWIWNMEPVVWTTLGTTWGRCHNWVGFPGKTPYKILWRSAGWNMTPLGIAEACKNCFILHCPLNVLSPNETGKGKQAADNFITFFISGLSRLALFSSWASWR